MSYFKKKRELSRIIALIAFICFSWRSLQPMTLLLPSIEQAVKFTANSFANAASSVLSQLKQLPFPSIESRTQSSPLMPRIVINDPLNMQPIANSPAKLPTPVPCADSAIQFPAITPVEFKPIISDASPTIRPSMGGTVLINEHIKHDSFFSSYEQCLNAQNHIIDTAQANGTFGHLSQSVNQFVSWLYDLGRSDAVGINARLALDRIQPPLPLLEFHFEQFKKEVCHYLFNSDWSVKTQLSKNDTYCIAQLTADFVKNGMGKLTQQSFISTGYAHKVPGFDYLSGTTSRSFIESFKSAAARFFNFGSFKPKLVLKNEFNKTFTTLSSHLSNGRFQEAHELIRSLPAHSEQTKQLITFYQEAYGAVFNRFGVAHVYESDPYFQKQLSTLQPRFTPDVALNQTLAHRAQLYESICNNLEITGAPSLLVNELVYYMVDQFTAPSSNFTDVITHLCTQLSSESTHPTMKQAYNLFFNEQGVLRILAPHSSFKNRMLPPTIHADACRYEKVLLNVLAGIPSADLQTQSHIDRALNYITGACNNTMHASDYRTLAHEMVRALVDPNADKTILACGDLSTMQCTVPMAAQVIRLRDSYPRESKQYSQLNSTLLTIDRARTAAENGTFIFKPHEIKKALPFPASPKITNTHAPPTAAPQETSSWAQTVLSYLAGGLIIGNLQTGPQRFPSSSYARQKIDTVMPAPTGIHGSREKPPHEKESQPVFSGKPNAQSQADAPDTEMLTESVGSADEADAPTGPRFPRCGSPGGMPLFFYDVQNTQSKTGQNATTKGEPDCIEQANKLPEFAQIVLAEKANVYFRTQIAHYEPQIVQKIQEKLNEQNIVHPHPIVINDINMKHVMFAEWNGRKPTGLHSRRWNSERIVEMTIQPGILGTSAGKVQLNCVTKPSSFFPDSWDEYQIVDKIIESIIKADEIKLNHDSFSIMGLTSEGIDITVKLLFTGKIVTVFPTKERGDKLCIY